MSIKNSTSPFLIGIVGTSPPCGFNASLHGANKWQSTSPTLVGNTTKLDDVIDRKFPNDLDSASFFIKVIGHKLSDGSSRDLYLRCRMNFAADVVQTQTPKFMDLEFSAINALDESSGIGTRVSRIRRPMDGTHLINPGPCFW